MFSIVWAARCSRSRACRRPFRACACTRSCGRRCDAGGSLVLGAEVVSCERDGSRVVSVATRSAGHDAHYGAAWFVLASGGFGSGGIELDSRWAAHERALGLPLR